MPERQYSETIQWEGFAPSPFIANLAVVVWLKIRKNDIMCEQKINQNLVVVWLKIRKNDIYFSRNINEVKVVVWLKIRKNDINHFIM